MNSAYSFLTIQNSTSSLSKEKGSKFWGFAYPVSDENEIKNYLAELKAFHPKATHCCYAWRLGSDNNLYRIQDDGEPSGTAGKPILGQIDSWGITNCLVVVIRYFGGTKLGVSGLITAYKNAAKNTLSLAQIVEKELFKIVQITCTYEQLQLAYNWIQTFEGEILEQSLDNDCSFQVKIPLRLYGQAQNSSSHYFPLRIHILML